MSRSMIPTALFCMKRSPMAPAPDKSWPALQQSGTFSGGPVTSLEADGLCPCVQALLDAFVLLPRDIPRVSVPKQRVPLFARHPFPAHAPVGLLAPAVPAQGVGPGVPAVDERWAFVFSAYELGLAHGAGGATGPEVGNLVHSYRDLGHLIADLDPLGSSPRQHPLLRLEEFGIREADLRVDECEGFRGWGRVTLRELLVALRDTYCRTLGIEYMEIPDKERRDSLQDRMEPSRNHPALFPDQRRCILERLIAAGGFEQFLHAKYVTATRFSLKEALMPLLDTVVEPAGGRLPIVGRRPLELVRSRL